jgi:hypothetical protein
MRHVVFQLWGTGNEIAFRRNSRTLRYCARRHKARVWSLFEIEIWTIFSSAPSLPPFISPNRVRVLWKKEKKLFLPVASLLRRISNDICWLAKLNVWRARLEFTTQKTINERLALTMLDSKQNLLWHEKALDRHLIRQLSANREKNLFEKP